ncbi:hypothetical protein DCO58_12040 [Helicobacter saguini]|uniref:Lipoprotein n=1 Tax=Helicobacter saguini TaxID=1548018 RepID=A0A099BGH1_9HELI|nr:hypothetical protein [Helicobacter saguini]MWV60980.1 hypothetical protein [Helicobacter saguini]MWV68351.1 hypothetical protein [Helicobacter saguini]MWV70184.1 hypothetical protein [Helicobacter saguini]MWV72087.1 hypothetical protein [Helicobacter saguini]TLD93694.1 hypothetical protein LS64_007820 [Helicobacter saguini]
MFRISNVSKKMVGVCAFILSPFIFTACSNNETNEIKETAYDLLKKNIDNKWKICKEITTKDYEKLGNLKSIDYKDSIIKVNDGQGSIDYAFVLYDLKFENKSILIELPFIRSDDNFNGKKEEKFVFSRMGEIYCGEDAQKYFDIMKNKIEKS